MARNNLLAEKSFSSGLIQLRELYGPFESGWWAIPALLMLDRPLFIRLCRLM
jgi:hypothetical protein